MLKRWTAAAAVMAIGAEPGHGSRCQSSVNQRRVDVTEALNIFVGEHDFVGTGSQNAVPDEDVATVPFFGEQEATPLGYIRQRSVDFVVRTAVCPE